MRASATKHKILLTGGAGFIGSHVAEGYLNAGHEVVIADNLSTGREKNIPKQARFYKADICDTKQMAEIFEKEKPSVVNHHAAQIDVRTSMADPAEDARINIVAGLNLLELSRKSGVKKWIFASSGGAIYGESGAEPHSETSPPSPLSPYGVSKLALEKYVELYGRLYGLSYTILRYANVYGPRQIPKAEGGVIAVFIEALLKKKSPTIYGDGKQLRDFVYVEEIAAANVAALTQASNQIVNLSTGRPTSISQLFELLKSDLKFDGGPVFAPKREGEIFKSVLDCARAQKSLGWKGAIPLQEGLRKTIHWTRNCHVL